MLNSVNGGQGLVVNVLWSVANAQNYPDTRASIFILHTRRCIHCCAGMLWLNVKMLKTDLYSAIKSDTGNILFKISKNSAVRPIDLGQRPAYSF